MLTAALVLRLTRGERPTSCEYMVPKSETWHGWFLGKVSMLKLSQLPFRALARHDRRSEHAVQPLDLESPLRKMKTLAVEGDVFEKDGLPPYCRE